MLSLFHDEEKKIKPGNDTSDEESDKGSHVTSSSSSYKGGTDTDSSSESELDAHHTPSTFKNCFKYRICL